MEQGQCYWMQTKRKYSLSSSTNLDSSLSWEEQAFAEDAAAGSLGGCTWPPRSYSCSFCRREFRSAQALGGHMNVHRKDRARLKQPCSPKNNEILFHHHNDHLETHQTPFIAPPSLGYLHPSPVCGLAYKKTNPNPDPDDNFLASPSSLPSPNSKPILLPPSIDPRTLIPLYDSSILHKISPVNSSHKFHPEVVDIEKVSKGVEYSRCMGEDSNDDDIDVAMRLNLVLCRTQQSVQFESIKEAEEDRNCKKRKIDTTSSNDQIFQESRSVDLQHMQPKVFEFSPSTNIEELDLELRLGI